MISPIEKLIATIFSFKRLKNRYSC